MNSLLDYQLFFQILSKQNKLTFFKKLIENFFCLLFDIPFWICGLLSAIIAPWRIYDYVSKEYSELPYYQKRYECFYTLIQSILDWVLIILFLPLVVLTYIFRYPYINQTLTAIFKKDKKNAKRPDSSKLKLYDKQFLFNNLQLFMIDYIQVGFWDVLFSPLFFLVMLPLYTIPKYLRELRICQVESYQVSLHRQYALKLYKIVFMDIIKLILLSIIYTTYYKINLYKQILEFMKQTVLKRLEQQKKIEEIESINSQYEIKMVSMISVFCVIMLDLISALPRAIIFLTYIAQRKYKKYLDVKQKEIKNKNRDFIEELFEYEVYKCQLIYKTVVLLIISLILGIICLCFSLIATWRIPFLIMLFKNKIFREQIIQQGKTTNPLNIAKIYSIVMFSYILDIIYFPLLILSFFMNPFVVINYIKNYSYRYKTDTTYNIQNQIYLHKRIIFHNVFKSALKDLTLTFRILVVILSGVRMIFLYFLVQKNQISKQNIWQEFYLLVKPKSNRINHQTKDGQQQNNIINQQQIIENQKEGQQQQQQIFNDSLEYFQFQNQIISKRLTFRKCVNISFIESLKDLPIAIFSIIIMILFPWRILSILSLWKLTVIRIPLIEDEFGRVKLRNIRSDLFKLFGEIFTYDFPCVIFNLILAVSVVKIPIAYELFKQHLQKTFKNQKNEISDIIEKFDYRKELKKQIKILWQESQTNGQYISVYILQIRFKSLERRLKRFDEKQQTFEKLKLYSLMNPVPIEDRPTRPCMQTISFNAYSKVAEFLDAKDLASMQLVNRKLFIFTKQELLWEKLFNSKYKKFNINYYQDDPKQKCVEGFLHEKRQKIGKHISEEEKDEIIGKNHIIFDEYLTTIFEFPLFLVNKFGKLAQFMPKFPETLQELQQTRNGQNRLYYIDILSHLIFLAQSHIVQDARIQADIKTQIRFQIFVFFFISYLKKQIKGIFQIFISYQNQNNSHQKLIFNIQKLIQNRESPVDLFMRVYFSCMNIFEGYVYYISQIPYRILKLANAGYPRTFLIDNANHQNVIDYEVPVQSYPQAKQFTYYFFQPLVLLLLLFVFQTFLFGLFEIKFYYLNGSFLESLFWPNPLIVLIVQAGNIALINQFFKFFQRLFVFFKPFVIYTYIFKKIINFISQTYKKIAIVVRQVLRKVVSIGRAVTQPLYDKVVYYLSQIIKLISVFKLVKNFIKFIFQIITHFVEKIKSIMSSSKNGYYQLLTKSYYFLSKFNILGDILFTVFVVVWMFWPFLIAYYYRLISLWISAFAISAVLMVKGYQI